MNSKEIVLYDNTNDYEKRNYVRENLFESMREENDWVFLSDVPEKMIDDEIDFENEEDWRYLVSKMREMFKNGHYMLMGYCGRWNGKAACGTFLDSVETLIRGISHLDYLKIYDENGHLYISGSHHDGDDFYEIKKLTNKGYELASSYYFENSKDFHQKLFNCNLFSCLPRLASI